MNSFTYGGIKSSDYGVWISGTGTFSSPTKNVETVSIPGRNGDLALDHKRFENIEVTYPAFISREFQERFDDFRAAMLSLSGYQLLEDTYHNGEYRLALFVGPLEPTTTAWNRAGSFDITFNCKPQRYLMEGFETTTFTSSGVIPNRTLYEAKPFLRIIGSGTVTIGDVVITIASHNQNYIDIDCESMTCFCGSVAMGSYVLFSDYEYPTLPAGLTNISMSGVTSVAVTPRFFTI